MRGTPRAAPGLLALVLAPVLALVAAPASPAELYRYIDDEGVTVLSQTLPPRYASGGYTVLDRHGQVVRRVEPELSPEERAQRAVRQAREEAERSAREARFARDERLLSLYADPEEVTRALERKLATIRASIDASRAAIRRLEEQRRGLEQRAADYERRGDPVPGELLATLRLVARQIAEEERQIASLHERIGAVRQTYAADRARLRELLGMGIGDGRSGEAAEVGEPPARS